MAKNTTKQAPKTKKSRSVTPVSVPANDSVESPSGLSAAQALDARFGASVAKLTSGLSPASLALAWGDWAMQFALHPAHASQLLSRAFQIGLEELADANGSSTESPKRKIDARFTDPLWQQWPWSARSHAQLALERWWGEAAALPGMEPHHVRQVQLIGRQTLEALSPANQPWWRPDVYRRTAESLGANLFEGWQRATEEWRTQIGATSLAPEGSEWQVGKSVAVTPGRVVHRNHLVELIQYAPATAKVYREPVFIVPSWIMKYYILDLAQHHSLVRWLTERGHTVFILSWRNPDAGDAGLTMQDYIDLGIRDSLAAIGRILPGVDVHACGYCLGGTLLALAAAAAERKAVAGLPSLRTITLLAALVDFSEPGELGAFIDVAQVEMIENLMADKGYLSGAQMAGSFTFLHARELYWARRMQELFLGETSAPNDMMAWNADTTRMPAAMHSQYLRRCYLANEIAEAKFTVDGQPVSLQDINVPMFVVGTETDHVSPWKSVYKIHRLVASPLTFVLTNGGHNAGIVSEPGHPGRHYALSERAARDPVLDPDAWRAAATRCDGSWWTAWSDWMIAHGSANQVSARSVQAGLGPAPGAYVFVRYQD